jgi:prophage antirepressor-like protein
MGNKLEIFRNEQFGEIRTVIIGGEPWFVLKDICNVLEIGNSSDVKSRLENDDLGSTEVIDAMGRNQKTTIINEFALLNVF